MTGFLESRITAKRMPRTRPSAIEATLMRMVFHRPLMIDGSNTLSHTVSQMMLPWEKA